MARRRSGFRRTGAGRKLAPGVILGVVIAVAAIGGVIYQSGQQGGSSVQQAGDDTAAGAGRVATGPARASEGFFGRLGGMWNAAGRIEELEDENRDLRAWRDLAERLAERNARYEALLRMPEDAFGAGADIENSIAAQLVLDSGGPFTRTLVANAGGDHGVRVGFIAVNENGLIGRVVSVGNRSARVLMLDDFTSRIPVMGEASRVRAVLAGQATRPPELITRPFQMQAPMLDFIVGAQSLREGERVITSGDGGLYPRGIPVGVARRDRDGQWRVALAAAQQPIDFVRILPYIGIAQPEDTAPESAPPPPNTGGSSVADISNETMAPAPSYQPPPPPPPPRPRAQTTSPAQPAAARTTPAPPPSPLPAQVIAPQPQPDTPSPAPEPQE